MAAISRGYEAFIAQSKHLHEVSERFFFWRSVEGIGDTMDLKKNLDLATLRDVLSLKMGSTVARQIRRHTPDKRVAQMLDHFVQYVGSSPYGSPAVLCSIGHMQTSEGIWYPMGGTRAVPVALEQLAGELGVELRPSTEITRISTQGGRAAGVVTSTGESLACSAVVSNMDAVRTYRELVGGAAEKSFGRRWNSRKPACSGVVCILASTAPINTWRTTTSSSRAIRRRSLTGFIVAASRRPIRPATSPPPAAPTRQPLHRVARRSTS